jgi:small subunit ribosomal protein S17
MKKKLKGKVISFKQQNTVIVEVARTVAHPLYKKLMRKTKKYQVDTDGKTVVEGMIVRIVETPKISKNKYFAIEGEIK